MRRMRQMVAGAMALLWSLNGAQALTPFATLADWTCSDESERLVVARTLVFIAGQGVPAFKVSFFMHCIEEAAEGPDRFYPTRISDVANGCVAMELMVLTHSG